MKTVITIDWPWFNDTSFQFSLLSAFIHRWQTLMSVMSALKWHWLTFMCWLGPLADVCFICKHCPARCNSMYCECWKLATAFFSIWSWSKNLTSVLLSFAWVEFYYIRCRQGQGSLITAPRYLPTQYSGHEMTTHWGGDVFLHIPLHSFQLNLTLEMYTKSVEWFIWSIFLITVFNGRQKLFVSCTCILLITFINRFVLSVWKCVDQWSVQKCKQNILRLCVLWLNSYFYLISFVVTL
jgi:hypothetical protein